MDTRLTEFRPIRIQRYVPELDLLNNPLLRSNEKEFLADFYKFLEDELDEDLRALEELNYILEEPIEEKKKSIVIGIMKKLSDHGYYSTIMQEEDDYEVGRIMRNALIAYALCGGRWSEYSERYIAGNWSIEMGRLAGGTLYCNPVNYKADAYQREQFLKPVAVEGKIGASAMTEFNAGSDIMSMENRLIEEDDEIVIKGKKVFITNGMIANYIIVYGRMNNGQLGAVIVDTEDQQLKSFRAARVHTYGMRDAFVSRLIFDRVKIPKENLLQGNGLDIMFHQLTEERLIISAEALGDAMKKILYSHTWAINREQFDNRLHDYQVIRFPISANIRQLNLLISALIEYARELDERPELGNSKLMAANAMGLKIQTTELAFESSIHCFRTLGGRGFIRQYSNQIGLLDPYCMIHGGGSNYVLEDSESRRFFKTKPSRKKADILPRIDLFLE
ncbi:MAG: Isovaleryl-CoA dehydrogenase [Promethearchaeota archaeon]|nr:MAG: Isovaleryl-CoA dehydrogenase [Candidatus Lokiarchaeota archaeon]